MKIKNIRTKREIEIGLNRGIREEKYFLISENRVRNFLSKRELISIINNFNREEK